MDNFSEQTAVFCHKKPRLGASVLTGAGTFSSKTKKFGFTGRRVLSDQKQRQFIANMHKIPSLPVNNDKHFQLLFSSVKDTQSKKLSPLLNVYIKHLVVTTVYSGIIAAIFTRVKRPLLPQIIRSCTQRLPRFNIAPKLQQKSHEYRLPQPLTITSETLQPQLGLTKNISTIIKFVFMSLLLLLFTLAKSLRSALVSPVSMTTFLPN